MKGGVGGERTYAFSPTCRTVCIIATVGSRNVRSLMERSNSDLSAVQSLALSVVTFSTGFKRNKMRSAFTQV